MRRKSYKQVATSVSPAVLLTVVPTLEFKPAVVIWAGLVEIAKLLAFAATTAAGVVMEKASPPFGTGQSEKHARVAGCLSSSDFKKTN